MANFKLCVDEDDIEELLELVPRELTVELLELEQENRAEKEAKEKETAEEEKKEPSREFSEGFTRCFSRPQQIP